MDVKITLNSDEIKSAVKAYINTQGMNLIVREVNVANNEAVAICEKIRPSSSVNYLDR